MDDEDVNPEQGDCCTLANLALGERVTTDGGAVFRDVKCKACGFVQDRLYVGHVATPAAVEAVLAIVREVLTGKPMSLTHALADIEAAVLARGEVQAKD